MSLKRLLLPPTPARPAPRNLSLAFASLIPRRCPARSFPPSSLGSARPGPQAWLDTCCARRGDARRSGSNRGDRIERRGDLTVCAVCDSVGRATTTPAPAGLDATLRHVTSRHVTFLACTACIIAHIPVHAEPRGGEGERRGAEGRPAGGGGKATGLRLRAGRKGLEA